MIREFRIELPATEAESLVERGLGRDGPRIRTTVGHRINASARATIRGAFRNRHPLELAWVASAVPHVMMAAGNLLGILTWGMSLVAKISAPTRVWDPMKCFSASFRYFHEEDFLGMPIFPNVMEAAAMSRALQASRSSRLPLQGGRRVDRLDNRVRQRCPRGYLPQWPFARTFLAGAQNFAFATRARSSATSFSCSLWFRRMPATLSFRECQ